MTFFGDLEDDHRAYGGYCDETGGVGIEKDDFATLVDDVLGIVDASRRYAGKLQRRRQGKKTVWKQ